MGNFVGETIYFLECCKNFLLFRQNTETFKWELGSIRIFSFRVRLRVSISFGNCNIPSPTSFSSKANIATYCRTDN